MTKRANLVSQGLLSSLIIVQLFCCRLWSLDPGKKPGQYLQWEIFDGIPSPTILAINQTPDGYLWIGATKGIRRFDGMRFSMPTVSSGNGIASLETRILFVDTKGVLWIGNKEGLTAYDSRAGSFKTFTGKDGIAVDCKGIRCIKGDMKGNLWVGFETCCVDRFSNGKFFHFNTSPELASSRTNSIVEDTQGNLFFGTRENGIFIYKDGKFSKYILPGLGNALIIVMYIDRSGELWIGSNKGLCRVTGKANKTYTTEDGLTDNYITSIAEDSGGNLWVGTSKGLNRIQKTQAGKIVFASILESLPINCLYEDREKSLWVGTDGSGLKRLKDGKLTSFTPFEAFPEESPLSLFEDRNGDTWIGAQSGKLFHLRGRRFLESFAPPEFYGTGIAAIAEDNEGNLWLGTLGEGVFRKKNSAFTQFSISHGLADNMVESIYRDSRGNLWFGTFAGVSVFSPRTGIIESLKSEDGLSGRIANICEDRFHNIWIAADNGITMLKKGELKKESMIKYLAGAEITYLYKDAASSPANGAGDIFWAATKGAGLKRIQDKNITSFTTENGMTTDVLYQLLEDEQGNAWLMSDSGILRVAKNELNLFAGGGIDRIHCTSFDLSDGLKSLEFDDIRSGNSALKTGNGEFLFITKKGISVVNPAKLLPDNEPLRVIIEAIFFDGNPVPFRLDAGKHRFVGLAEIRLQFTAPTFLSPGKIAFKYRLRGRDRKWVFVPAGKERTAIYNNLDPGTYTFEATACNAEGMWNQTVTSLSFTLTPFFYQTLFFKIAVILLLVILSAAAFYIYKKYSLRKRVKYKASPLQPDFAEECVKKLTELMEKEKIYCNPDISLQSLAERLSISPHILSQVLNERLKRNFSDFINSYRIEEAKRILESRAGGQRKISVTALDVGFNTMAAFYKAFKRHTGATPTAFQKKLDNKE